MRRSRDGDATDVAGALRGHRADLNRTRSVERRDGFSSFFPFSSTFSHKISNTSKLVYERELLVFRYFPVYFLFQILYSLSSQSI